MFDDELLTGFSTEELDVVSFAEEAGSAAEEVGSVAEETGSTAEDAGSTAEDAGSVAEEVGSAADETGFAAEELAGTGCVAEESASRTELLIASWLSGISATDELDSLAFELAGVGPCAGPTMLSESSLQPLMAAAAAIPNVAAMAVFVAFESLTPLKTFLFSIFIKQLLKQHFIPVI